MKASEVLERTLAVLEEDGWCQRWYRNEQGQRCLVGALVKVTRDPSQWKEFDVAQQYITPLITAEGYTTIPAWNDTLSRTYEDVKRLLNQAREAALADEAALVAN